MPDAKQRRATVSGGSPTFERNSLMVDDPVIRPKTQALNKVHREATLAVLTASENNLKSRVGGGEEEGLPKGEAVWRKTSSESSSGQKGPSESEMEDSVFSSDKEDKDQQTSKKPSPEKEHQQFRVTRPTPILLEPTADPTPPSKSPLRRTSSSSSSVSSTTSSSTLINSPHTAPKLRGTDSTGKLKAPEALPRTSSPTSSPNVAHSPAEQHTANKKHSSSNARSPAAPRKRSFTSMFTRDSSRKASAKSKQASDSGKKTSGDGGKKTEKEKKNSAESRSGKTSSDRERKTNVACDSGQKTHAVTGKGEKSETGRDGGRVTSPVSNSVKQSSTIREGEDNSRVCEPADEVNHVAEVTRNAEARSIPDSSRRIPHQEPSLADNTGNRTESSSDLDVDKSVKDCVSAPSEVSDSQSQSYAVTKDTPVAGEEGSEGRESLIVSQDVHSEVAKDAEDNSMPQLIRVTKLATEAPSPNVMKASDDIPKGGSPKVEAPKEDAVPAEPPVVDAAKVKKHVEFSPQTKETSSSEDLSSTHGAVGGRTQLFLGEKSVSGSTESVRMRHKSSTRRAAADRRVSCKDLGQGDCEGWLYKKKEKDRTLSRQWHKRWCVLKSYNLYYYKNKEELRAEGVIYMPAFQVSPAPGQKSKKFAFKIHNSGTTFYFASERQDDMSKWMNKMGLAAISFNTSTVTNIGGFARPEPRCQHLEVPCNMYYSESDEDAEETPALLAGSTPSLLSMEPLSYTTSPSPPIHRRGMAAVPSDPRLPAGGQGSGSLMESGVHGPKAASVKETSGDDLHTVLRAIHSQDLTIDGVDRRKRRTRHLSSIMGAADGKTDANVAKLRKLLALKRTLKVREQELLDIERLLESHPTPSRLRDFVYRHPDLRL